MLYRLLYFLIGYLPGYLLMLFLDKHTGFGEKMYSKFKLDSTSKQVTFTVTFLILFSVLSTVLMDLLNVQGSFEETFRGLTIGILVYIITVPTIINNKNKEKFK